MPVRAPTPPLHQEGTCNASSRLSLNRSLATVKVLHTHHPREQGAVQRPLCASSLFGLLIANMMLIKNCSSFNCCVHKVQSGVPLFEKRNVSTENASSQRVSSEHVCCKMPVHTHAQQLLKSKHSVQLLHTMHHLLFRYISTWLHALTHLCAVFLLQLSTWHAELDW